ncbi:MAG: BamA/TamA family outer membrane protein [Bacteroidales bacterium]
MIIASCNPAKYLPEGETLLDKSEIKVDEPAIRKSRLSPYIRQVPNKRIFGTRFHLGLYNLSNLDKEGWPHGWLRNIGEKPVVFDPFAAVKSAGEIENYLFYKGYFNSTVRADYSTRKEKTSVTYDVEAGKPYRFGNIEYRIADTTIRKLIYMDTVNCLISKGEKYDIDILEGEILRVERFIRDLGFYAFSRDNINFVGDSAAGDRRVDITFMVSLQKRIGANGIITEVPHRRYRIRNMYILPEFDPGRSLSGGEDYITGLDTTLYRGFNFIDRVEKPVLKYDVIIQSLYIKPGDLYQVTNRERSEAHLNSLKSYRLVNVRYREAPTAPGPSGERYLDCIIQLTPVVQQAFTVEFEGTNSGGNLGGAVNLIYLHRNLFRGAEQLNIKLKGAYETLSEGASGSRSTQEYGFETTLTFPKFLLPFLESETFVKNYNPRTVLKAAYNYQTLPVYTRTVANATFGYSWKAGNYTNHSVNPIQLNIVNLPYIEAGFEQRIDTSTYLAFSYKDIFIVGGNYTYIFNNQNIKKSRDYWYVKINGELAGNLLAGYNMLTGSDKVDESYEVFGQPYAQYLKGDIDIRYNTRINDASSVAYRLFMGAGIPYGNSRAIPFEKQYFGGGANGIRAWQVRSLGPGSYSSGEDFFYNQTADIKLEVNAEYRFKLFWIMEGATFLDVGNIWTFYTDEDRPGSKFEFNTFINEIAVGSGVGLRFDLSFVTIRTDLGIKLRDPSSALSQAWIPGSRPMTWRDDFTLSFSIGYPF